MEPTQDEMNERWEFAKNFANTINKMFDRGFVIFYHNGTQKLKSKLVIEDDGIYIQSSANCRLSIAPNRIDYEGVPYWTREEFVKKFSDWAYVNPGEFKPLTETVNCFVRVGDTWNH